TIGSDPDRRLAWLILLGSIPAAIVGGLGESKINDIFHTPTYLRTGLIVIAVMMILMAGVLLVAQRVGAHLLGLPDLRLHSAPGIGGAQALALIPGVSRAGSTITAGLF